MGRGVRSAKPRACRGSFSFGKAAVCDRTTGPGWLKSRSPVNATDPSSEPALGAVIIPLLKGIVYQENDPALWGRLIQLEPRVRDYVAVLELELVLDSAEGYAFLRSREPGEESRNVPRLYPRRPLSFPVSLLLALLRKKLAEFDASGGDSRLVLSLEEVAETVGACHGGGHRCLTPARWSSPPMTR